MAQAVPEPSRLVGDGTAGLLFRQGSGRLGNSIPVAIVPYAMARRDVLARAMLEVGGGQTPQNAQHSAAIQGISEESTPDTGHKKTPAEPGLDESRPLGTAGNKDGEGVEGSACEDPVLSKKLSRELARLNSRGGRPDAGRFSAEKILAGEPALAVLDRIWHLLAAGNESVPVGSHR